ncbi:MAG: CbiX/SirB N-terminal domain-containing protein [Burkholderiales bacterium]|nr:CbiX/SirB N-terminal domain-containing protein [Burkholderiales bacterium]
MDTSTPATGIVLFAHGARDPQWARPFERLLALLEARAPGVAAELAFLEHMTPDLTSAVGALADRGVERITVVPLFMAQGSHLRHDLPRMIERATAANPGVLVRTLAAIGDVEPLLDAIAAWILDEHRLTGEADLGHPLA